MGFPEEQQVSESEGTIWVIAGIPLRAPLRPIKVKPTGNGAKDEEEERAEATPTEKEARIPEALICPPAPKKRRPSLKCNLEGVEVFSVPADLNSMFMRRVEKAN